MSAEVQPTFTVECVDRDFCTFHTSVWRPSNDQNLKFHIFTRLSGRWTRTLNPFRFDPWPQAPNWLPCSPRDKSEISGISQICRSGCEQLLHQPEPWTPNQSNSGSDWGVGGGRGDGGGGGGVEGGGLNVYKYLIISKKKEMFPRWLGQLSVRAQRIHFQNNL